MKRLLLIVSMIIVAMAFTGCTTDEKEKENLYTSMMMFLQDVEKAPRINQMTLPQLLHGMRIFQ